MPAWSCISICCITSTWETMRQCLARALTQIWICVCVAKSVGSETKRKTRLTKCSRSLFPHPGRSVDLILWRRCGISGQHLQNSHDAVSRAAGLFGEGVSLSCQELSSQAWSLGASDFSGDIFRCRLPTLLRLLFATDQAETHVSVTL